MSYCVSSARQWALQEFGGVDLKDRRLNRRVVQIAQGMAEDPCGSIPQQNQSWKQIKGAYRLFDHDRATFEALSQAHWEQTRVRSSQREGARQPCVTVMIQDTTQLTFTHHSSTSGLGHLRCKEQQGLFLHSVLAVAPQASEQAAGAVLGLAWAKLWARHESMLDDLGDKKARNRRRHQNRCGEDRESTRWVQAVKELGSAPPGCRWIYVGDRESDLFDLFEQTQQLKNVGFVIRLRHQRNATAGHQDQVLCGVDRPQSDLHEVCRSMKQLGTTRLYIAPRGGRPGRWAELAVSGGAVTIYSPWYGPKGSRVARPLLLWAVRVWEITEPSTANEQDAEQGIEWMLLSSEPVNDLADALRITQYYSLRWLIEEYHQCLKSGCKVEDRQLESADRLAPLIAMLSITATRILQLKNDARLTPDLPAQQCVPQDELRVLATKLKVKASSLTVGRFVHEVAKLGGFIGRKSDGQPGWLTLWRGWHQLSMMTAGYQLAKEAMRYG